MANLSFLVFSWTIGLLAVVVSAEVVPFIEPGFFFSYGSTPVTQQCETIRLIWGRQSATGPNPVAPYSFQIFTSSYVVPFIINAGNGGDSGSGNLFFDYTVPFAPGTKYQICMYDSNGVPGGCQVMYTMIQNSTVASPTCQNVTMPALLDVKGVVDGGPMSQNGFINQCDDVSIQPLNGTPPFTLTISPPNHPPFNMTSHTMDPIVWTVSMTRAMPFFMSLVSSEGYVWANGPMGVGKSDVDACLAPDTVLRSKAHSIAAGAGVGGLFGGFFLVGVAWLVNRFWLRRRRAASRLGFINPIPWSEKRSTGSSSSSSSEISQMPSDFDGYHRGWVAGETRSGRQTQPRSLTSEAVRGRGGVNDDRGASESTTVGSSQSVPQVYVRHQDAGRIPSSSRDVIREREVVELPPTYVVRESVERARRPEKRGVIEDQEEEEELEGRRRV